MKLLAELYFDYEPNRDGRAVARNTATLIEGRGQTFEEALINLREATRRHFLLLSDSQQPDPVEFHAEYLNEPQDSFK